MDMLDPNRVAPYIDTEDPNLAKLRNEIAEPMCTKSRIDILDPKRAAP
jgi:hypothetical protein